MADSPVVGSTEALLMTVSSGLGLWNSTETPDNARPITKWPDVPVFGLPGYVFDLIHITALTTIAVSLFFSVSVLVTFACGCRPFFQRSIGERLVLYLAVADVGHGISHSLDHSYMMATRYHPPDVICAIYAFFLGEFTLVQSFVVCFTAVNAFILVVKEVKVSLGKYDWRLLAVVFGLPAAGLVPAASLGMLGQSGAWCYADLRKPSGPYVTNTQSAIFLVIFFAVLVCYLLVWGKIRQVTRAARALGGRTGQSSNTKTARVMMLFVVAYMAQWSFFVVYSIWSLIDLPNLASIIAVVILCNMGGLFNFLAYTFIRRQLKAGSKRPAGVKMSDKTSSESSVSKSASTTTVSSKV